MRETILAQAVRVASTNGLEGVTIGHLATSVGMSKAGVLGHFGSKQNLQLAVLDEVSKIFTVSIIESGVDQPPGLRRLSRWCEAWMNYLDSDVFPGGCFVTAVSAEFDGRLGPVRDRVVAILSTWLSALQDEIDVAQEAGELSNDVDSKQIAMELNGFVMSANQSRQLFGDKSALELMRRSIRERLTLHVPVAHDVGIPSQ
jgi:AcrR family transcriptional regulator